MTEGGFEVGEPERKTRGQEVGREDTLAGEQEVISHLAEGQARSEGGIVLYGSDLGNGPIPPGVDVSEVLLLREAGLQTETILQALARGPLERNAPGDLLALGRNPFEELEAFEDVRMVVRGGRLVS